MRIAGSEHRLPRGRICVAEKLYPPLWMLIFGLQLALESGFDRGALAQKSAQGSARKNNRGGINAP